MAPKEIHFSYKIESDINKSRIRKRKISNQFSIDIPRPKMRKDIGNFEIKFRMRYDTLPGERLFITGNRDFLGG